MADKSHRYKEKFTWFPGEYERPEKDSTQFKLYEELQELCRNITGGNKDSNKSDTDSSKTHGKTYGACTYQYGARCNTGRVHRAPSITYFLKGINGNPETFQAIKEHEIDHQKAVFAKNLISCDSLQRLEDSTIPKDLNLYKTFQDAIDTLSSQMDQREKAQCDSSGNCEFRRSFEMQQKLDSLLDLYQRTVKQKLNQNSPTEYGGFAP